METNYPDLAARAWAVLESNDRLGFDTVREAACAVLDHADWNGRWEIPDEDDQAILARWRYARLRGRRVDS